MGKKAEIRHYGVLLESIIHHFSGKLHKKKWESLLSSKAQFKFAIQTLPLRPNGMKTGASDGFLDLTVFLPVPAGFFFGPVL